MTAEPRPVEGHVPDAARRRLDEQLAALRGFERRLTAQARAAQEAARPPEYLREILQRRLGVRARMEEVEVRLGALVSGRRGAGLG